MNISQQDIANLFRNVVKHIVMMYLLAETCVSKNFEI